MNATRVLYVADKFGLAYHMVDFTVGALHAPAACGAKPPPDGWAMAASHGIRARIACEECRALVQRAPRPPAP